MRKKPINTCPVPSGILVIIGGKENKGEKPEEEIQKGNDEPMEVLKSFIAVTGKKNPEVEIITTANSQSKELFQDYSKAFKILGLSSPGQIHHDTRDEVLYDTELVNRLKKADAVFLTGGDQLKLTTIYGGTELLVLLKQRYIGDGLVLGGTSAGAMAMSTPMIFAGNQDVQQIAGEVKITTGLEFLKDVCIDTHFVDRGRFVRMAQVIATNPTCIGVGIEEDTALIIKNGIDAEVCGSGIVITIDGSEITKSNLLDFGTKTPVSIHNLKVNLLSKGDTFTIPQRNPPHI